jgi:hypothetical protein
MPLKYRFVLSKTAARGKLDEVREGVCERERVWLGERERVDVPLGLRVCDGVPVAVIEGVRVGVSVPLSVWEGVCVPLGEALPLRLAVADSLGEIDCELDWLRDCVSLGEALPLWLAVSDCDAEEDGLGVADWLDVGAHPSLKAATSMPA